ncbi:MAG: hypothetical protein M1822_008359 [Bathelium mastoideum]|nr:MAG: hypothetical protein M1822_008359 [Bathelium mastoideum]
MDEEPQTLSSCFGDAEDKRGKVDSALDFGTATFQENVTAAITAYDQCLKIADQISLFSPNETLEDASSKNLPYFLLNFRRAELLQKSQQQDRKVLLRKAESGYGDFLKLLDQYDVLSRDDFRLLEQWREDPERFSTASTHDATQRRETKISRYKREKELKRKLEYLKQNPDALHNDEATLRQLYLLEIEFATHQTFQSLESIAQELQILKLAPPEQPSASTAQHGDGRQRSGDRSNGYSERLDPPISQLSASGNAGPILDRNGKPLRPFTILDNRQRLRDGVFRPDHNLPTMTIDEYLEEEKRRGGIIEGGGPQSGIRPEPNEDDMDKADEETMKARAWDEFKEDNPRGSGNTINRG